MWQRVYIKRKLFLFVSVCVVSFAGKEINSESDTSAVHMDQYLIEVKTATVYTE